MTPALAAELGRKGLSLKFTAYPFAGARRRGIVAGAHGEREFLGDSEHTIAVDINSALQDGTLDDLGDHRPDEGPRPR